MAKASPPPSSPPPAQLPFQRRVLIATGIIAGLLVLSLFLWYAIYIFLLAFAGVLVAIFLHALADLIAWPTGLSKGWALIIAIALLIVVIGGATVLIAPRISEQVDQLAEKLPESIQAIADYLERYRWGQWLIDQYHQMGDMRPDGPEVVTRATGVITTVTGALISVIVVLFVGLYVAVNPELYTNGLLRLVPIEHRERGAEILAAMGYTLRWWLIGQLIAMAAVGVMTTIGLWLLGVPLALTLGILAFFLDFVPNFGPIVAAAPGILLALVDSPQKALYVVIMYIVVQQIESLIITPLVHQRTVLIPPALTILAQVLLGVLVGPLGLLLATPLVAAAMVLAKMLYVEAALGDEVDTPDDHLDPDEKPPVPKPDSGQAEQRKSSTPPAADDDAHRTEPQRAQRRAPPGAASRSRDPHEREPPS